MKDRLLEIYNDIKGGKITENSLNQEIEVAENDIKNLDKKIEEIDSQIQTKTATLESITSTGKKADEGKEKLSAEIEGLKEQKQKYEKEKNKKSKIKSNAEKKKQNILGYTKYASQIEKIQKFKKSMQKKHEDVVKAIEIGTNRLNDLNKTIEEKRKQHVKLKAINNDPTKTEQLTNSQYDKLQEDIKKIKEDIIKLYDEIQKQKETNQKNESKKIELEGKIGKCDLAWKTLFTNKDWDEIQRRTVSDKTRFTQKKNAQKIKSASDPIKADAQDLKNKQKIQPSNEPIKVEPSDSEVKLPAVQKKSAYKKITEFLSRTVNKVKSLFKFDKKSQTVMSSDTNPVVDTEKTAVVQNQEKDTFMESLRRHVDVEYGQEVKAQKEKEYIEQHKAKVDKQR